MPESVESSGSACDLRPTGARFESQLGDWFEQTFFLLLSRDTSRKYSDSASYKVEIHIWLPRDRRRGSATARLLGLLVRILWMSVRCECCVMSGRGLCDGLITRLEMPYRVCMCVCVFDLFSK